MFLSYLSHKVWETGMTFDLLTWTSIGVIYSWRTNYLPRLKQLVGQSVLELSVAQGEVNYHDLWPTDLNINRGHLLIKDYLPIKFEACGAKRSWVISCTRWSRLASPLTYWPEYQYGSSTHQGLSTYQVWSFLGRVFLSYQLHKVKGYRHTDRHVQRNMPLFLWRGHNE